MVGHRFFFTRGEHHGFSFCKVLGMLEENIVLKQCARMVQVFKSPRGDGSAQKFD